MYIQLSGEIHLTCMGVDPKEFACESCAGNSLKRHLKLYIMYGCPHRMEISIVGPPMNEKVNCR